MHNIFIYIYIYIHRYTYIYASSCHDCDSLHEFQPGSVVEAFHARTDDKLELPASALEDRLDTGSLP